MATSAHRGNQGTIHDKTWLSTGSSRGFGTGGFGLTAALDLEAPGISRADAVELMERAHEACPYSRATRGDIDVTLTVGGATLERQAA